MHLNANSARISGDRALRCALGLVTAVILGASAAGCGSTATPRSRHVLEVRLVVGGPDAIGSRGTCGHFEGDPLSHQPPPGRICRRYATAICPTHTEAAIPFGRGWEMVCARSRGTKYLLGPAFLNGAAFAKAVLTTGPAGQKVVDIDLAPAFVVEFAHVTADLANTGQQAAMTFDDQLISSGPMDAPISTGQLEIIGASNASVIANWVNGS